MREEAQQEGVSRRQTRQRLLIYDAVAGTQSHPTAQWVYEQVRRQIPRISLGTIYRNLRLLVAQGRLRAWKRGRTARFDADISAHDHFACRACGLLLDIEPTPEEVSAERRLKARGHEVHERVMEFIGLCRDCRRGRGLTRSEGEKRWHL